MFKKFILLWLCFAQGLLLANTLEQSVNVIQKSNDQLKRYQSSIDKNEEKREELLNAYKHTNGALKNTQKFNIQLEKIIQSQNEELQSINQQLIDIEETQKNIYPLMMEMITSLKVLIEQDTPFLLNERKERIAKLESTLDKADVKAHEKYRIILEAFKIEYDYAKTIEAYQDKIDNKTYNILRLGRVALYSQSLDLKNYAYYNRQNNQWQEITDSKSKSNIRKAIKIAKKQENVRLLNLPFLAQKESK